MNTEIMKKLIDVAAGRVPADIVIKNCKVVDVYSGTIIEGDIAFAGGMIAGVGTYEGETVIDGTGKYAAPGFIDAHIHIESAYVTPEEIGRLLVPHGGTTIVADPHEIANVCGVEGVKYMLEAAENTVLDVKYMVPSCVPATPFENAGAILGSKEVAELLADDRVLGLGEFMNFPGVIYNDPDVLAKLAAAQEIGKPIDGHSPSLSGNDLNAYAAGRILTEHECDTVEDMHDRIRRGMYVLLRQGSACHNLKPLLKGLTPENSRRCLLCSDDRQPKTILALGHLNNHLQICVEEGVDPITAIRMATLNAAECFGMKDRGAIAPGLRGDVVLLDDLKDFHVHKVLIEGAVVAEEGKYLPEITIHDSSSVRGCFKVKDFSVDRLKMSLKSNKVHAIQVLPGGVVTAKAIVEVETDGTGDFIYNSEEDLVKVAVIERHNNTGNVAVALLKGYGIKQGAVALSVAHDSHNIIVVGVNDEDMAYAVEELIVQGGGVVLACDGEVKANMPMPIGGIMSDQSGEWVDEKLTEIHEVAHKELKISGDVEPVMTLCFMSLAVIPEVKLTDMGLFDVLKFDFIPLEAE
ncbi:MAG: adenine deaminase [Eubacteriales bacterium]